VIIDEDKLFVLSNYSKVKGKKDSDHNTLISKFSLTITSKKPPREEYFNFKDKECQEIFFNETNYTSAFSACFENEKDIKEQGQAWFKTLNKFFHKSFKKVRFNGKVKETEISKLLDERRKTSWG
jgi:hypothetical protein